MSLATTLAPPPVPSARPMDAVQHWDALASCLAPHVHRCRAQERPHSVLRITITPVTPPDGPITAPVRLLLVSACALRLRAAIRSVDQIARVGDTGIAILLDGTSAVGASAAAGRLVKLCELPYRIDRQQLEVCLQIDLDGG